MAATFARVTSRRDLGQSTTGMTCDSSYPAGGYPVTPSQLGILTMKDLSGNFVGQPDRVDCVVKTGQGLTAQYDYTAGAGFIGKIKLFVSGTTDSVLNEAGSNDVSSAVIVRLVAQGSPSFS
jgi:hypothetical protein